MSSPEKSRQVVFSAPGTIEFDEQALPVPRGDDLLIRVRAVGVCATDLHLLAGHIGDPFPLVPGHEFVGEVVSIGPSSTRFLHIGDRVAVEMLLPCRRCDRCREGRYNLCELDDDSAGLPRGRQYGVNIPRTVEPGLWGGYADYLYVPEEAIVHQIPAAVSEQSAVLVEPLAVAYRALNRGRIAPGDRVAIIGPGPVGILAAAAARSAGAAGVAVLGTRDSRLSLAQRFGADGAVNTRESADVHSELAEILGGPADLVVEIAGVPAAQEQAVSLVRRGGRVVLAGACGAGAPVSFLADEQLLTREIDVLPSFLSAGGFEPAIALLARDEWPFAELVTHRFDIADVAKAFDIIERRAENVLKVVLVPGLGKRS